MVLVKIIEDLTQWIKENICNQVVLMEPHVEAKVKTKELTYVNPKTFSLYIPAKEMLPPNSGAKFPCICVQLLDGQDDLLQGEETLNIRLAFAAWNPGLFKKSTEEVEELVLTRNADGWKDIWNFVETAKRILQENIYIAGMRIDKNEPMKFGFFANEETLVNAWPEWYAWLSFRMVCGTAIRKNNNYDDLL